MAKIAIDCDGVLANFTKAYGETANRLFGDARYKEGWEPPDWNFGGLYTPEEDAKIWERIVGTQNFWLGLDAYSDNVGALARWFIDHNNHEVYIVSSRTPSVGLNITQQTNLWVRSCGVREMHNYFGVIIVPDSHQKAHLYRVLEFDYSIDDKTETVEQCDRTKMAHRAALLDRPWNQHADVKWRTPSVATFLAEIK
jgi:hypothetical protein